MFEGNTQTLDHVLASASLNEGAEFDVVHINSEFAVQTSDHDPLLARFEIEAPDLLRCRSCMRRTSRPGSMRWTGPATSPPSSTISRRPTSTRSPSSSGDNYLPSPFFNAGGDPSMEEVYETAFEDFYNLAPGTLNLAPSVGRADIAMLNIIGVAGLRDRQSRVRRRHARGPEHHRAHQQHHRCDHAGWIGTQFPYLSANIDFSGDPNLNPLFTATIQNANAYNTSPTTVFAGAPAGISARPDRARDHHRGERRMIGVVGATTQIVRDASRRPAASTIIGDDEDDMAALAAILQPTIDALIAQGVNIIVLASHLQQIALRAGSSRRCCTASTSSSRGGSNTLLADSEDVTRGLRPGDTAGRHLPDHHRRMPTARRR